MLKLLRKNILVILWFIIGGIPLAMSQENKERAREYYLKGNLYYQQGKYAEAQEEFKKALDLINQKEETKNTGTASYQKIENGQASSASQQAIKPVTEIGIKTGNTGVLEYIIGNEDILHISVWQNPDLDQEAIVRPDGRISFPLIGDVQAVGLTITQLDEGLTVRLKEYIKYPEVSIFLKKMGGQKVLVLGEVRGPGVYSVTGAKTILEAVTLAGGFSRDAVPSSVILITGGFEKPQAKRMNLSKALQGDLRQNVALHAEDIVFVPRKFIADLNYFLGQVLDPLVKGAYTYKEYQTFGATRAVTKQE